MCNLDLWFRSKGSSSNQDAAIDVSDFSGPPTFQSTGMSCENLDYSLTSDVSRTSGSSQTSKSNHFDYRKYSMVRKWTVGLSGGKDLIAVIRASGRISHARGLNVPRSGIVGEQFIEKIRRVRESKRFKAVVIRIDSPGGDALASDLMWREIRLLAASKPVIASMADVAASGGYYMAMATGVIVAEDLTLTGSIGVVTGEPSNSHSYGKLYEKIGFNKEILSRGRYAELTVAEHRPFRGKHRLDATIPHPHRNMTLKFQLLCLLMVFVLTFLVVAKYIAANYPKPGRLLEHAGLLCGVTAFFVAITVSFPLCLKLISWMVYVLSLLVISICNCHTFT
ncbi:hypothetical protein HYC85_021867 [Camellia sinensis]|uniref:Peptidase S49 domain-containing protein n=1 Tax=Camellia sinensis TaxID=4442 RepID=A0A7J7GJ59_CAMSI|nr:hypothetical protein HYC85_021867 [Camellia sinensis]